jgi:gamma-glutamylcyclotransferase (GGCT)/AIG2-like uncharacterized protein YtfP
MPLYFSYGANMDVGAMAARCPSSRALGRARLPRHRIFIMREGYASVRRAPNDEVHGVLWDLALADVRALDAFEGVDRGLYAKILQPVITETGPRRALVYVGGTLETGVPKPGYVDGVLASAVHWDLPVAYQRQLARLRAGAGRAPAPDVEGGAVPTPAVARVRPRAAAPASSAGLASRGPGAGISGGSA